MQLLLFDVDGVLIEPHGYHYALQATLQKLGRMCGMPDCNLTEEDIAAFESDGVSTEWDSSAISLAYLLTLVWRSAPDFRLPDRLAADPPPFHLPAPDFRALTTALAGIRNQGWTPLERGAHLLLGNDSLNPEQQTYLREIFAHARSESGINYLLFQELVAGSAAFARLYHLPPAFNAESYLMLYDKPLLLPDDARALNAWVRQPGQGAALFTARPGDSHQSAPSALEAERGAELLGLDGIPIASQGKIAWMSQRLDLPEQSLIKPAPAHVLLALLLAAGVPLEETLQPVKAFLMESGGSSALRRLHGAQVRIFEDTSTGIRSLQNAVERLGRMGIDLQVQVVGISTHPAKIAALRDTGAQVFADIRSALQACGIL